MIPYRTKSTWGPPYIPSQPGPEPLPWMWRGRPHLHRPGRYDMALYAGDTYRWQFRLWTDRDRSAPLNLDGALLKAQIRNRPAGWTVQSLELTVELPNIVYALLTAEQSAALPFPEGYWDLQLQFPKLVATTGEWDAGESWDTAGQNWDEAAAPEAMMARGSTASNSSNGWDSGQSWDSGQHWDQPHEEPGGGDILTVLAGRVSVEADITDSWPPREPLRIIH